MQPVVVSSIGLTGFFAGVFLVRMLFWVVVLAFVVNDSHVRTSTYIHA
jgi:uncharacterized membrane protein